MKRYMVNGDGYVHVRAITCENRECRPVVVLDPESPAHADQMREALLASFGDISNALRSLSAGWSE